MTYIFTHTYIFSNIFIHAKYDQIQKLQPRNVCVIEINNVNKSPCRIEQRNLFFFTRN